MVLVKKTNVAVKLNLPQSCDSYVGECHAYTNTARQMYGRKVK